jgi:ATP-dependent Lon protease
MPSNIKQNLKIIPVRWIDEVLAVALEKIPVPGKKIEKASKQTAKKEKKTKNKTITAH